MSSDPLLLSLLLGAGLIAGFIDAIAGGGGMLTIPALMYSGLPPHAVLATNKLAASFGSATASFTYYKKKLFSPKHWRLALIFTAIGAIIGTIVIGQINAVWLDRLIPIIVGAAALYTMFNPIKATPPEVTTQHRPRTQIIQGTVLGFYDGAAGPGTGAFWTVSVAALHKLDLLRSAGVAKAMNFVSNIVSLVVFSTLGHVHLWLGLAMGLSIMIGAYIGAHSAIRFGNRFIRPFFTIIVLLLTLNLAREAWFGV